MPLRSIWWIAVTLLLLLPTVACTATERGSSATPQTVDKAPTASSDAATGAEHTTLTITTANGSSIELFAELAVTPEERAHGLTGRRELDPDSGMLFIIPPRGRGFWMKDTPIALTIAFIDTCGVIVDLIDMQPLSEEIKNASQPYGFALEMEQGWFSEKGIAIGDTVTLPPDLLPANC